MKKFIATALTMLTVFSCSAVAFAADETVLTTTVPDATYTLNIPADQEIPFGATSTDIGNVTATNGSGFAEGKDLKVTLSYDPFKADGVSTTIPFTLDLFGTSGTGETYEEYKLSIASGDAITFKGQASGGVQETIKVGSWYYYGSTGPVYSETMRVLMDSKDWGKALGGDYSSTITFTAEIVSSQS